jgi:hypothetical protein
MYHAWWDCVYEDAKQVFKQCGITIDDIYFSGFSSQGDGACFQGSWYARDVKPGGVKDWAPLDERLHSIAAEFECIAEKFPGAWFKVRHSGHYQHKYCTDFEFEFEGDPIDDMTYDSPEWQDRQKLLNAASKTLTEAARDAMQWIYDTLRKEYEYQTSEEVFAELAEVNEWEFTESGKLY